MNTWTSSPELLWESLHQLFTISFDKNYHQTTEILKVPLLWVMKVHILVLGVPNNRLTCMQGQKTHRLKICIYFFLFCSQLPNGSFNDSFFQTPPLRDANLQWLVWWPNLLWLVFCVQRMSITERPSPLSPQLGDKHPNSHVLDVSPMQKRIDKALQFVHQRIALFFIRTPNNNNDKHSLFINISRQLRANRYCC